MTARPKLRWFRFGLRTMFVAVTVAACWLGWQRAGLDFENSAQKMRTVQDEKQILVRKELREATLPRAGFKIGF